MQAKYSDGVVLERHGLTDRITELKIGSADGRALPMAEAGSHIELRFGGAGGHFLRHYSVVGPLNLEDGVEPFWRIASRNVTGTTSRTSSPRRQIPPSTTGGSSHAITGPWTRASTRS